MRILVQDIKTKKLFLIGEQSLILGARNGKYKIIRDEKKANNFSRKMNFLVGCLEHINIANNYVYILSENNRIISKEWKMYNKYEDLIKEHRISSADTLSEAKDLAIKLYPYSVNKEIFLARSLADKILVEILEEHSRIGWIKNPKQEMLEEGRVSILISSIANSYKNKIEGRYYLPKSPNAYRYHGRI